MVTTEVPTLAHIFMGFSNYLEKYWTFFTCNHPKYQLGESNFQLINLSVLLLQKNDVAQK